MTYFPELPKHEDTLIHLENTDKALPATLDQNMRYAYFKTIAHGGKAIIQSCKDLYMSRIVCYKQLKPEFADNPIEQQRFLRESRVNALLQHQNIVPVYELGRNVKGLYYFTMKLVYGYTLREILDYRERYDLKQLIDVVIQVAQALDYAHSHRVIHRDIKPENILVGPYGEVLLLDWGLAKVWDPDRPSDALTEVTVTKPTTNQPVTSITDAEKLQGTICYMSPEQIRRDPNIDFRTDIFSLGVVLFEMLAGRPPAIGETVDEISQQIQHVAPVKPSSLTDRHIPKLLETITMRCINKELTARMQNCSKLIRLLKEDWS